MSYFINHTDVELFNLADDLKLMNTFNNDSFLIQEVIRIFGNTDMIYVSICAISRELALELSKRYKNKLYEQQ